MIPSWAALQFAFLMVVAIGAIAIAIAELKVVEKAEKADLEGLWEKTREELANLHR